MRTTYVFAALLVAAMLAEWWGAGPALARAVAGIRLACRGWR